MSVAQAIGMLRQEHPEFEASLRDKEQLCVKSLLMKCALGVPSGGKHAGRLSAGGKGKDLCGNNR